MAESVVVSVLMTSFNREKYIAEAIESVLASTYQNFELIIVDDCSTDKTIEIAKSFQERDSRIRVFYNSENLGDYPNRNKAASYATGKYLKYLDSDDTILPHGLEKFVNLMERYPNAGFGLSLDAVYYPVRPKLKYPHEIFLEHFSGKGIINCGPSGSIIRRDIFDRHKGFLEKRYISDAELWLRLSQTNSLLLLPPNLIKWREHDDQEFRKGSIQNDYVILRFNLAMDYIFSKSSPISLFNRLRFTFNQLKLLLINAYRIFKANKNQGSQLLKTLLSK